MPTYAIGDIQGCYTELKQLLKHIHFNPQEDVLWFTGDLVNRGPQSLEVLRFVKELGDQHVCVLGNHDLHLIAAAYDAKQLRPNDTFDEILAAADRRELIDWLRARPLLHHDTNLGFVMTHAGLAPSWTLAHAKKLAHEVEKVLRSNTPQTFLQHMYGNLPDAWDDGLAGPDRLRCITNFFTRMRFCHHDGRLELSYKGTIADKPQDLIPWFEVPKRANADLKIIFGHWAALGGKASVPHLYPLDTGCVWGNELTAMRLEDERRFSVPAVATRHL